MNKETNIKEIELLKIKDGKYHIKIGNYNFPIILDKKLYKTWIKRNTELMSEA